MSGTMRTSSALTVTTYQDGFFHVGPSPTEKKWFLTPFFFPSRSRDATDVIDAIDPTTQPTMKLFRVEDLDCWLLCGHVQPTETPGGGVCRATTPDPSHFRTTGHSARAEAI
jgi:hypothetical protein